MTLAFVADVDFECLVEYEGIRGHIDRGSASQASKARNKATYELVMR